VSKDPALKSIELEKQYVCWLLQYSNPLILIINLLEVYRNLLLKRITNYHQELQNYPAGLLASLMEQSKGQGCSRNLCNGSL
jgi:hypothetical protein